MAEHKFACQSKNKRRGTWKTLFDCQIFLQKFKCLNLFSYRSSKFNKIYTRIKHLHSLRISLSTVNKFHFFSRFNLQNVNFTRTRMKWTVARCENDNKKHSFKMKDQHFNLIMSCWLIQIKIHERYKKFLPAGWCRDAQVKDFLHLVQCHVR